MSIDENETPEFNEFNTRASRRQGLCPKNKTHINYLPLIDAKPSDPSTIPTSMMKAQRLTNASTFSSGCVSKYSANPPTIA